MYFPHTVCTDNSIARILLLVEEQLEFTVINVNPVGGGGGECGQWVGI